MKKNVPFFAALIIASLVFYFINVGHPNAVVVKPDLIPHKHDRLALDEVLGRLGGRAAPTAANIKPRQASLPLEQFLAQLKL